MRLTILAVLVVFLAIMDQYKYSGHYGREVVSVIDKGAARIGAMFR